MNITQIEIFKNKPNESYFIHIISNNNQLTRHITHTDLKLNYEYDKEIIKLIDFDSNLNESEKNILIYL